MFMSVNKLCKLVDECLLTQSINNATDIELFFPLLDLKMLLQIITKMWTKDFVDVELIYLIYKHLTVTPHQFLTMLSGKKNLIKQFNCQLIEAINSEQSDYWLFVNAILPGMVQIRFSSDTSIQCEATDHFLDELAKNVKEKLNTGSSIIGFNVYKIVANSEIDEATLKKYFSSQIVYFARETETRNQNTLNHVICKQKGWTYSKTDKFTKSVIYHLLLPFDSTDIQSILKQILDLPYINWRIFLNILSHFLILYDNGLKIFKDLTTNLVSESLLNSDERKIVFSLILARHAANEGPHIHPPYGEWIKATFHENAPCSNNKKLFALLMKVLTDLVPHEPTEYLRLHIINPPFIPFNCRSYFSEYATLAKTKLQDLKVVDEEIFKYDNQMTKCSEDVQNKLLAQANADVQKMIRAFEDTGKIPAHVTELSIFRKPYYLGRFLPALLTIEETPTVSDTKVKFIKALQKAGKIPINLYQKYETDCKQAKEVRVEISETSENCIRKLCKLIDELPEKLLKCFTFKIDTVKQFTEIEERLNYSFSKELYEGNGSILLTSTHHFNTDSLQVINALTKSFGKMLCIKNDSNYPWHEKLLSLIVPYKSLQETLYHRLENILKKVSKLSNSHLWAFSALLAHLGSLQCLWPVYVNKEMEREGGNAVDVITQLVPCETDEELTLALKFFSYYMQYAFLHFSSFSTQVGCETSKAYIPKLLIQKYSLVPRIYPNTQSSNCPTVIRHIYNSEEYHSLYNSTFN